MILGIAVRDVNSSFEKIQVNKRGGECDECDTSKHVQLIMV